MDARDKKRRQEARRLPAPVSEARLAAMWTAHFMNGDPMPPELAHWSEAVRRDVRLTRPRPDQTP